MHELLTTIGVVVVVVLSIMVICRCVHRPFIGGTAEHYAGLDSAAQQYDSTTPPPTNTGAGTVLPVLSFNGVKRDPVFGKATVDKLQLGTKWILSGVGDGEANDDWLRLKDAKDGKTYKGGLASAKMWTQNLEAENITAKRGIAVKDSDPGVLIEKRYGAAADRYGVGQFPKGATRLYASGTYGPATINLGFAKDGANAFNDVVTIDAKNQVGVFGNMTVQPQGAAVGKTSTITMSSSGPGDGSPNKLIVGVEGSGNFGGNSAVINTARGGVAGDADLYIKTNNTEAIKVSGKDQTVNVKQQLCVGGKCMTGADVDKLKAVNPNAAPLTASDMYTAGKLRLGAKWQLSGKGDGHADDAWLRLMNSSGSDYYGGFAAGKLWVRDSIELNGVVLDRNKLDKLAKMADRTTCNAAGCKMT